MSDTTYSFVYDRSSADLAFHGIAVRELTLSILAAIPPESNWDGCVVYRGPSPLDGADICLATQGPAADTIQLRLIEALEQQGVRILQVYEGGPEITEPMMNAVEVAIRAYDPCLSCATHALGQMPLEVSLFDAENNLLDSRRT